MSAFSFLRRFCTDAKGNIAILFGLAIIPVVGAMGVAIDYSLANASRTALQASLDNTGLMLAKRMPLTDTQLSAQGWQIFQANLGASPLVYQQSDLVIRQTTSTVVLDISTTYNTQLASVLKLVGGRTSFPVGSHTEVSWGNSRLRVALALDNTGSMSQSGKIGALQTATTNLINQLKGVSQTNGDVYVSIVPFVRDVNIGGNVASWPSWVDSTFWAAPPANVPTISTSVGPGSACPFPASNKSGYLGYVCTTGAANGSATTGTVPSSGLICPSVDSGTVNTMQSGVYYNGCYNSTTYSCTGSSCTCTGHDLSICSCTGSGNSKNCKTASGKHEHAWVANASTSWNGCVMDRGASAAPGTGADYDQNVTAPTSGTSLFPAQQYSLCPAQQIVALTYDWTALTNAVNAMSPNGSTNQPIGLVLGWQSLVGGGPFPAAPALDPNYTYNQYIILLSDGLNTQDRWYGDGSNTSTQVDNRMYYQNGSTISGTCKNAKDAGIKIYTVQVDTGGDPTSTLLQNCASDPSMFFKLTSSSQIVTTFQAIGNALANLHLSQ
jgi:Flp pilus assembly protein TadG